MTARLKASTWATRSPLGSGRGGPDGQADQPAHRGDHLLGRRERVVAAHEDVGGDAGLGKALAEPADGEVAAAVLAAPEGSRAARRAC